MAVSDAPPLPSPFPNQPTHTTAQVSLWDARASEAGGLVERLSIGGPGSAVHCLDWCAAQGGLLGAAGVERSVFMIDPRK